MLHRIAWMTICMLLVPNGGDGAERFSAMFSDETRLQADEIKEWCDPTAMPTLAGRALFGSKAQLRWLVDQTQPSAPASTKYVEFLGGDRFAGEVIAYGDGPPNRFEPIPRHLIVKPVADLQPPEITVAAEIRVTIDWIRRIAWDAHADREYRPGTIWLRNGLSIPFRSIRWIEKGVIVLTAEGVKQITFVELSELHLPQLDPWTAYIEQVARLSPDASIQLVQLDCNDGSRLTTSFERFQARHLGDRARPENWYQLVQPAWSLDPMWMRFRTIRKWLCYSPSEVPLSKFAPQKLRHQAVFGSSFDWQVDLSALRTPLRSETQEFGWGWGVQGSSDLVFEVPPIVRAIRTKYGLDRTAGNGGCVHVQLISEEMPTAVNHRFLIGSKFVGDSNWIDLPGNSSKPRQITFRSEMAHEGRPSGADPFDIGDTLNWYEPEVRLDPAGLAAEIGKHRVEALTGINGWTIPPAEFASWKTRSCLDASDSRDPRFRIVSCAEGPFYTLSRQFKISPTDRWLTIVASRFADTSTSCALQVRIDGRVMADSELAVRDSMSDPQPIVVPVESLQGQTVLVELVVFPSDAQSWIDWRTVSVGPDRPGQWTLFDDDPGFAELLTTGDGRVEIDLAEHHTGLRSLKVSAGMKGVANLPALKAEITEFPRLGQYRYIAFDWKKPAGNRVQFGFANHGRLDFSGPPAADGLSDALARQGLSRSQTPQLRGRRFGYCYEVGVATTQPPLPLWMNGELPRDWQRVERDLFADFGSFVMTGVKFNSGNEDAADKNVAWFDRLILARTEFDLAYAALNVEPSSKQDDRAVSKEARAQAAHELAILNFSEIAPLFSPRASSFLLTRIPKHAGIENVVRTECDVADDSITLRAAVALSSERISNLEIVVGHEERESWQLIVRANGNLLTETAINDSTSAAGHGWFTVKADLARYAGKKVLLELSIPAVPGKKQVAFWKSIRLIRL